MSKKDYAMAYVQSEQNILRASWAKEAVLAFGQETRDCIIRDLDHVESREEVIADLLCDLLHYAQQNGCDPILLAQTAIAGFEIESGGEV